MTKADIVSRITNGTDLNRKESVEVLDALFELMKETIVDGEPLKISGFGSFIPREKNDRRGRNPRTGEDVMIEARMVLRFKPSMVLKNAINGSRNAE